MTGTGPRSRIVAADIEDALKNAVAKPKAAVAPAKAAAKKSELSDESG